jgi:hypothetical protein
VLSDPERFDEVEEKDLTQTSPGWTGGILLTPLTSSVVVHDLDVLRT